MGEVLIGKLLWKLGLLPVDWLTAGLKQKVLDWDREESVLEQALSKWGKDNAERCGDFDPQEFLSKRWVGEGSDNALSSAEQELSDRLVSGRIPTKDQWMAVLSERREKMRGSGVFHSDWIQIDHKVVEADLRSLADVLVAALAQIDGLRNTEVVRASQDAHDALEELHAVLSSLAVSKERARVTGSAPQRNRRTPCVILCGGSGRRLWPLIAPKEDIPLLESQGATVRTLPKPLLPLADKSILGQWLTKLHRSRGVGPTYLATNRDQAPLFSKFLEQDTTLRKFLDKEPAEGQFSIHIVPDGPNSHGAVKPVLDIIEEPEGRGSSWSSDLLVIGGDNVMDVDFPEFLDRARGNSSITNAVHPISGALVAPRVKYGCINTSGSRIVQFAEKPDKNPAKKDPRGFSHISTLLYYFPHSRIHVFRDFIDSDGSDQLPHFGDMISWILKKPSRGAIYSHEHSGKWHDIGTPGDYLAACITCLPERGKTSQCWISGGVIREGKCEIIRSFVGARTKIEDSTIEDSVVMEDCVIEDADIERCIIGPRSTVKGRLRDAVCAADSQLHGPPGPRDTT